MYEFPEFFLWQNFLKCVFIFLEEDWNIETKFVSLTFMLICAIKNSFFYLSQQYTCNLQLFDEFSGEFSLAKNCKVCYISGGRFEY